MRVASMRKGLAGVRDARLIRGTVANDAGVAAVLVPAARAAAEVRHQVCAIPKGGHLVSVAAIPRCQWAVADARAVRPIRPGIRAAFQGLCFACGAARRDTDGTLALVVPVAVTLPGLLVRPPRWTKADVTVEDAGVGAPRGAVRTKARDVVRVGRRRPGSLTGGQACAVSKARRRRMVARAAHSREAVEPVRVRVGKARRLRGRRRRRRPRGRRGRRRSRCRHDVHLLQVENPAAARQPQLHKSRSGDTRDDERPRPRLGVAMVIAVFLVRPAGQRLGGHEVSHIGAQRVVGGSVLEAGPQLKVPEAAGTAIIIEVVDLDRADVVSAAEINPQPRVGPIAVVVVCLAAVVDVVVDAVCRNLTQSRLRGHFRVHPRQAVVRRERRRRRGRGRRRRGWRWR
eukprot:scaffold91274_cov63-Phaeocystis_antarctica.AAC.1